MRTAYLLGAGVSKGSRFRLPTMNEFFDVPDFADREPLLFRFLRSLYPDRGLAGVNLEEVATHLDVAATEPVGTWFDASELTAVVRRLRAFIRERLQLPLDDDLCPIHEKLVDRAIAERAAVLSLNYDLVFEAALSRKVGGKSQGRPYHFWRESQWFFVDQYEDHIQAAVRTSDAFGDYFIKLHGGLNWWRCENSACLRHQMIVVQPYGMFGAYIPPGARCKSCGAAIETVMVPPTMKGVFTQVRRLAALWWLAFDALKKAQRIVVAGVSFSGTDYVLQWLVRQARMTRDEPVAELVIVNPSREADERTKGLLLPSRTVIYSDVSEYLDECSFTPR
jgi:hypothetical protein